MFVLPCCLLWWCGTVVTFPVTLLCTWLIFIFIHRSPGDEDSNLPFLLVRKSECGTHPVKSHVSCLLTWVGTERGQTLQNNQTQWPRHEQSSWQHDIAIYKVHTGDPHNQIQKEYLIVLLVSWWFGNTRSLWTTGWTHLGQSIIGQ